MKNILLEQFGSTVDWITVGVIAVVAILLILFLIAFIITITKSSHDKFDNKEKYLAGSTSKDTNAIKRGSLSVKMPEYTPLCSYCGAKINKITGKCSVCGKSNFEDRYKRFDMHNLNNKR